MIPILLHSSNADFNMFLSLESPWTGRFPLLVAETGQASDFLFNEQNMLETTLVTVSTLFLSLESAWTGRFLLLVAETGEASDFLFNEQNILETPLETVLTSLPVKSLTTSHLINPPMCKSFASTRFVFRNCLWLVPAWWNIFSVIVHAPWMSSKTQIHLGFVYEKEDIKLG